MVVASAPPMTFHSDIHPLLPEKKEGDVGEDLKLTGKICRQALCCVQYLLQINMELTG